MYTYSGIWKNNEAYNVKALTLKIQILIIIYD